MNSLGVLAGLLAFAALAFAEGEGDVFIGEILAKTGSEENFTAGFLPGIEIAQMHLDEIGWYGYNFTLQELDTQADRRKSVAAALALSGVKLTLQSEFNDKFKSMATIGPLFSGEAAVISYVAQQAGILMISPSATSPNLSNKLNHPTFARMLANDASQGKALAQVVKNFKWTKVAAIFTSDEYGQNLFNAFSDNTDRDVLSFVGSFPSGYKGDQIKQIVDDLQASQIRVVFLSMLLSDAEEVLKELRAKEMTGAPYVYLGTDAFVFSVITSTWSDLAKGMIATGPIGFSNTTEYKKFESAFTNKYPGQKIAIGAPLMYDAVFVAAKTISKYKNITKECEQDAEAYPNCSLYLSTDGKDQGNALFLTLTTYTTHNGASGEISVDLSGDRENARWGVYNPTNENTWERVGIIGFNDDGPVVDINQDSIIWSDGFNNQVPKAQPEEIFPFDGVKHDSPEFVFFAVLTSLVEFSSLGLLIFNIVYYETPAVKVTSPRLNLIIIIGLMVMVSYLYIQPFQTDGSCQAKAAVITIGFSLLFGTLVVKIFRVFRIFKEAEKGKTITISDNKLMLFVGLLVSIDVLVLLIWGLVDGARYEKRETDRKLQDGNPNSFFLEIHQDGYCTTDRIGFFGFFVAMKTLIMLAGIYFAVRSRHVSFKQLNDSRPVAFSIYSGSVTLIVLLFTLIYRDISTRATYSLVSSFFLVFVISTEVLLFGPRVYSVYTNEPFDLKDDAENETVVAGRKSATNRKEQPPVINM